MSILTDDKCLECGDTLYWYPAINEQGWRCCGCEHRPGEPPGYNPGIDKAAIRSKVNGLLHDVADAKLICISNGSHGDGLATLVARQCVALDRYDQTTILRLIFEADASYSEYWHKVGSGVRLGEDPRHRCLGGRLATRTAWRADGETVRSCSDQTCTCNAGDEVPF